jgi:hypothetical protein
MIDRGVKVSAVARQGMSFPVSRHVHHLNCHRALIDVISAWQVAGVSDITILRSESDPDGSARAVEAAIRHVGLSFGYEDCGFDSPLAPRGDPPRGRRSSVIFLSSLFAAQTHAANRSAFDALLRGGRVLLFEGGFDALAGAPSCERPDVLHIDASTVSHRVSRQLLDRDGTPGGRGFAVDLHWHANGAGGNAADQP